VWKKGAGAGRWGINENGLTERGQAGIDLVFNPGLRSRKYGHKEKNDGFWFLIECLSQGTKLALGPPPPYQGSKQRKGRKGKGKEGSPGRSCGGKLKGNDRCGGGGNEYYGIKNRPRGGESKGPEESDIEKGCLIAKT